MGELAEIIQPQMTASDSGFTMSQSFTSLAAGRRVTEGLTFGTERRVRLSPTGSVADVLGEPANGNVRYRNALAGSDLVVRPAAVGALLTVVRTDSVSRNYRFRVERPRGTSLVELPGGRAALISSDRASRLRSRLARVESVRDVDLRDPLDHAKIAEAAITAVAAKAQLRPLMVFVPIDGARLDVSRNELRLSVPATSGTTPTAISVAAVDPNDFIDDQDGTEQGTPCYLAEHDDNVGPAVASSQRTAGGPTARAAISIPGIKCYGYPRNARHTGGGNIEAVGSLACISGQWSLSVQSCIAIKRFGISFLSAYKDHSCPPQGNVAFGRFVGQTHVARCSTAGDGNHKYRTHIYSSVNGRKTQGYQKGRLHLKRC